MLKQYIGEILKRSPEFQSVVPVIEKEILHHDIMQVMVNRGVLQSLAFIGGTSLRLCHNSSRLSEDLDFNGGHDFKPSDFNGLEGDIQAYIERKYDTVVSVHKPNEDKQGNTKSWKISIEKEPNRPELPRQKMHIDVCAIPSFDLEKRPLINHYGLSLPTEGLLIPTQSKQETLADKFIALAYRSRRIKPRDVWDIVWLHQVGTEVLDQWVDKKLDARGKTRSDFEAALRAQVTKLKTDPEVREDFTNEMSRFVSVTLKERTLDNPEYWGYVTGQVETMSDKLLGADKSSSNPFDMT